MSEGPAPWKVREEKGQVTFDVLVVPRASRCAVVGVHDGRLKVALDAPPVDGKANDALVAFIAKILGRPKRDVTIVRGDRGRQKTLAVRSVDVARVAELAVTK